MKAREISIALNIDKKDINQELYFNLTNLCEKDENNYWSIKKNAPQKVKEAVLCPKCNNEMVLRKGKYGKFYGCKKYPFCKGTKNL